MKRFSICGMLIATILMLCMSIVPSNIVCVASNEVSSKSACLMDFGSKEILYEKNSHEHLPVASMVKMMTILISLEEIEEGNISLDDIVTTSENAAGMGGSQVFIDPYEGYKLEDMLKSVIIASANDASVALAEHISGSESVFVRNMNKRANELGMLDTNYANCTGLPAPEQYSSAYDSALLLREVTKHDIYHNYSSIWMDELTHPSGRKTGLTNTNRLVKYYKGCDGGKTGSTNEAGCCLAASAQRDGMRLISVIVGSDNSKTRFGECSSLFNFGFANFENKDLVSSGSPIAKLEVSKGKIGEIDVFATEEFSAVVRKGEDTKYSIEVNLPKNIKAGIKKGQPLGSVVVSKDGTIIKEISISVNENVEKMSYFGGVKKILNAW